MKKKSLLYKDEQEKITNEIVKLLKLEDNQNKLILYNLDNDKDLQKQILSFIPEIRKYFCFHNKASIGRPETCKRPWLGIIKSICSRKYNISRKECKFHKVKTVMYIFQNI